MTVRHCAECGERVQVKSIFEESCPECGSEEFQDEDAWDPPVFELLCLTCGFETNTAQQPDPSWPDGQEAWPKSVDDPCPVCYQALTPRIGARPERARPEYGLAQKAASRARSEHCGSDPPFDPIVALRNLGLVVTVGPFDHDGILVASEVQVPEHQHPVVQRFTLAHELGHYVLDHTGDRQKIEPEANAFASEFLIPRSLLTQDVLASSSLGDLRRRFNVSKEAMTRAILGAGLAGRISR